MSPHELVGLLLGGCCAGSIVLLAAALRGWTPARLASNGRYATAFVSGPRLVGAVMAALVVTVATRWPVASVAAAGAVLMWPRVFGARKVAADEIERIEALATWTESLRDSIAGSIGLEEAIRHSVSSAPRTLQGSLQRLDGRLRAQMPLPQALSLFAEEFEDSSCDLVVAALLLNARLRGPGLVATLSALSLAAREEIDMRRRIEEGRKSLRRTAAVIVTVTGSFAGGLTLLSRDYVAPYATGTGQLVLAVVLGIFAAGLVWIRSAADLRPPARFLAPEPALTNLTGLTGPTRGEGWS